jgi:hypothetical protein
MISSDCGFQNTNESNESPDEQLSMACIRLTWTLLWLLFAPVANVHLDFMTCIGGLRADLSDYFHA